MATVVTRTHRNFT